MPAFIIYELKVAIILAVFYLCFKCFLSRESQHRTNRVVLLATSFLSFILPLCVITFNAPEEMTGIVGATKYSSEVGAAAAETLESLCTPSWAIVIAIIYSLGVVTVLGNIVAGIIKVQNLIKKGVKENLYGTEIVVCDGKTAPFSWMKWIVMCRTDFESGNHHILEHEKAHIRLGHSKDILLFNVMTAFQWFNPAMWLLKRELRSIHEYEADDAVLRGGVDIKEYQYSLIKKAVSASGYSITNSFNHSILKNRITMMSKSKSSRMAGLKALYILPLICGTLALNAQTVSGGKVNEKSPEVAVKFSELTKNPSFQGGSQANFAKWVRENVQYEKKTDKTEGAKIRVNVQFKVNSDGGVSDVKVVKGAGEKIDQEVIRVVSSSPKWEPGEVDGKKVAVTYTFPVILE